MKVEDYFSPSAQRSVRAAIADARGNEVFFIAWRRGQQVITEVEVLARGHETAVPVMLEAASQADAVIHNHPSGHLQPSSADLHIASTLGNSGVGFFIVNNDVSDIYAVVEMIEAQELVALDPEQLRRMLSAGGPVARRLSAFETRREQIMMLDQAVQAFNSGEVSLIEAGTGTGKSMAYLLPAALWAVQNKERCVVSTRTINLQQQLIEKDIPLLISALDLPLRYCLVKGRGNYVCLHKLSQAAQDLTQTLDEIELDDFRTIKEWADRTSDGSKSDLGILPTWQLWEKVNAESDTCLRARCPFYSKCFFMKARREAATSNLLVVNHHLLFADLAIRLATQNFSDAALLPAYHRLILDEAHNVEESASSYFGGQMTVLGLRRLLRRFYALQRNRERGLIPLLLIKLVRCPAAPALARKFREKVQLPIEETDGALDILLDAFLKFLQTHSRNDEEERKVRLTPAVIDSASFREQLLPPIQSVLGMIRALVHELKSWCHEVEQAVDDAELEAEFELLQLKAHTTRLQEAAGVVEQVIELKDDGRVRWLEGYETTRWRVARFIYAPLEVGPILSSALYQRLPTIILTSATLTAAGKFDYMTERLGLALSSNRKLSQLVLPPTFDYERQALIAIPTDMPFPDSREFKDELLERLRHLLDVTGGRAFVLFTSFRLLNSIYYALEHELHGKGITPLRQGSADRHRLLDHFKQDIKSTLFGTDSFWEGVDAPGETLQCVVLTKLPFRVPTEPIIEARVEALEKAGRNAFMNFTLPQAIIKFKQGFGRLIRTRTDRGAVVVFDRRIIDKHYGTQFLRSLPQCQLTSDSFANVLAKIGEFLS